MKKNIPINSSHFFDMLDCLMNQFHNGKSALCVENDFGMDITPGARDCFSIVVHPAKFPSDFTLLAVLSDDSVYFKTKNRITYAIYIDRSITTAVLSQPFLSILLAHEVCHFAFFYECFVKAELNAENDVHKYFIDALSEIVPGKQDIIYRPLSDRHSMPDLINNLGKYPKEHFTYGKDSKIDYKKFFYDFIDHLDLMDQPKKNN